MESSTFETGLTLAYLLDGPLGGPLGGPLSPGKAGEGGSSKCECGVCSGGGGLFKM